MSDLIGVPIPPTLREHTVPVPAEALAAWRTATTGLDLLMDDEPRKNGRDGMTTIAEVLLPHGSATFEAWHPDQGTPWARFFDAMLALARQTTTDPELSMQLAEIARYNHPA